MNDKITKQKIYSELVIRLDKLEYKLDKLLALMEEPKRIINTMTVEQWDSALVDVLTENSETIPGPPKPFIQMQDSEQFDESYK